MFNGMVETAFTILFFGVFGYLHANELTEPGEVFGWLPRLIKNKYLAKFTWQCAKCVAGFWSLWYVLLSNYDVLSLDLLKTTAFVSILSAFIADTLTKFIFR